MSKPFSKISGKPHSEPSEEVDDGRVAEATFEEIRTAQEELRQIVRAKTESRLEEVRKKREEAELLGKGRSTERIAVDSIDAGILEMRRGGVPDEIAALPLDHPVRIRWEKGYRQRRDGSWFRINVSDLEERRRVKFINRLKSRFSMTLVIALILVVPIGFSGYHKALVEVREKILATLDVKGIAPDDPWILREYGVVSQIKWLPTLKNILAEIEKLPKSISLFPDNPELGGYLGYITKHNKKFDPEEALDWDARMMRKSSQSYYHD